jgi:hypothetical protein
MAGKSNEYRRTSYNGVGFRALAAMAAAVAIYAAPSCALAQSGPPSGSVTMHVGQAGYIGGVTAGGVLHFRGRNYPFQIAGGGVGGMGVTRFDGGGPVYNLHSIGELAGPFAELRTGLAIGFRGKGKMMLRNRNGVVVQLKGTRRGLALSTGVDAMVVSFTR